MDRFSMVILERTVDLATEAMPPDRHAGVADCVSVIRQYIESPNAEYHKELHDAITGLLKMARENCQFLIAARLSTIARQLDSISGKSEVA